MKGRLQRSTVEPRLRSAGAAKPEIQKQAPQTGPRTEPNWVVCCAFPRGTDAELIATPRGGPKNMNEVCR
jgi:hypothetical protein